MITSRVETITPDFARKLLAHANPMNRPPLRDPKFYTARTKRAVNSGGAL